MTRHAHPYSQEWLRAKKFIGRFPSLLVIFLTLWTPLLVVQEQTDANPRKPDSGFIDYLLNYLNMAGTKKSNEFRPMTQPERNRRHCSISQVGGVAAGAFLAR